MKGHFERIRAQHQHKVYSFAYYSLRNTEDAKDVTQEAFIRLWKHWDTIDIQQAGSWLIKVARNLIIDHVRKQQSRIPHSEQDINLIEQTDEQLHQRTMKLIVEQSIPRLNDPYRTTMILREIQGLNYQDIAEILDVSTDQVKTNLFRGKRKLRDIVRQHPLYSADLFKEETVQ